MGWPRLDTRGWNLSLGAATTTMVAACGPTIILEEDSESASASDTDTETVGDTEVDPTMTVECVNSSQCDASFECIDNVCVPYDDYYCDDGCCYGDCCYGECHYYECYSDEECGPQGLCNTSYGYGECQYPEELPHCGGDPEIVAQLLPEPTGLPFVSLAFVDANGDAVADLVVGREGATELHMGPGDLPPTILPVPPDAVVGDAVSGDFDGDGDADLVLSTLDGRLMVLTNDGAGGFVLSSEQVVGASLHDLVALQWNGDGTLDVAGVTPEGQAMLHLGSGAGTFVANAALPTYGTATSLTKTRYAALSFDDLLVQDEVAGQLFLGSVTGDLDLDATLPGTIHGPRRVLSADLDGVSPDDALGVTPKSGWVLLEAWPNSEVGPLLYALAGSDGRGLADVGDIDGDGVSELIVSNGEGLTFVLGSGDAVLSCQSSYFVGQPVGALAVADFDGNGRADIAIWSGGAVSVLRTQ